MGAKFEGCKRMRCNWEKAILGRERIPELGIPEARTCLVCLRNRKEVSEGM